MKYAKPHLNYNAQVDLLRRRGLEIGDERAAVRALRRIGYYRLSAYTYVLRRPAPQGPSGPRLPPSDEFIDGATFEQAVALHDFDDRLRGVLLSGLQRIEVALRVQVGYQLGKTDPHGHLDAVHLDAARCREVAHVRGVGPGRTLHEEWLRRFHAFLDDARTEEFVRHFVWKYEGRLPIWAATEIMTFGCLTGLYNLRVEPRDGVPTAHPGDDPDAPSAPPPPPHGQQPRVRARRDHRAHAHLLGPDDELAAAAGDGRQEVPCRPGPRSPFVDGVSPGLAGDGALDLRTGLTEGTRPDALLPPWTR